MKKKPGQHQHHGNPQSGTSSQDPERSTPLTRMDKQVGHFPNWQKQISRRTNRPALSRSLSSQSTYSTGKMAPASQRLLHRAKKEDWTPVDQLIEAGPTPQESGQSRTLCHGSRWPCSRGARPVSFGAQPVMPILIRVRMTTRSGRQTRPGDREREKRKERTQRKSVVFRSHFEQDSRVRTGLRVRIFCSVFKGYQQVVKVGVHGFQ